MVQRYARNGVRSGITFGIVIIFLALTGFIVTGPVMIAKIFGDAPQGSAMPSVVYLVIMLALIGLWNGAYAARPQLHSKDDGIRSAITASLAAGLVTGVLLALLGLIYASLLANGTDPRAYLAMVSPVTMNLYLLNLPALSGVLSLLILMTFTGLAGGLLAHYYRRLAISQAVKNAFSNVNEKINQSALVNTIRKFPFTIYIIYALVAVLLFLVPRWVGSYWNYIIGTVGIYVIMGLGLNIIVGLAGQLVLGYVAFFAIGAYSVALLTAAVPHNLMWNFWLVVPIGIILAALTGVILGLPILRLRGDYLAIVTLGFGEIIRIMLRSDLLTPLTAGPKGIRNVGGPSLFGQPFTSDVEYMYLIIVAVLLVIFFTARLQKSRTGRAWEAIREDEIAARAAGINTFQSKLLALAIGAAFAGLGGILFASRNQFTGPEDHSLMVSINVLALVIVGGMGSIPGTILGAFALKGLPEILRELENYRLLVFGALLVVMMIIRPEGLWPARRQNLEKTSEAREQLAAEAISKAEGTQHAR
jgi:ABC-type branched-subunit amino acid transport system permease subunit